MRKLMILFVLVFVAISCGNKTKSANENVDDGNFGINDVKIISLIKNIKDSAKVDTNFFLTEDSVSFAAIYHQRDSTISLYVCDSIVTQELITESRDLYYTVLEFDIRDTGFILFPFWAQFN